METAPPDGDGNRGCPYILKSVGHVDARELSGRGGHLLLVIQSRRASCGISDVSELYEVVGCSEEKL